MHRFGTPSMLQFNNRLTAVKVINNNAAVAGTHTKKTFVRTDRIHSNVKSTTLLCRILPPVQKIIVPDIKPAMVILAILDTVGFNDLQAETSLGQVGVNYCAMEGSN